ncbi:MAG TPA: hypothetical protein VLJ83_08460, partial [Gemmatimonadaceae bacterium]|nr:hypothetical protein [Gemmatimonadaceae bacterium]
MLFRRFYDENLAQATYMLACEHTREAIIIDPNADIGHYTRAAGADRVKIRHVTETHIHADFLSGSVALAEAAGYSNAGSQPRNPTLGPAFFPATSEIRAQIPVTFSKGRACSN